MKKYIHFLWVGLILFNSCEKEKTNPKITTLQAVPTSASTCIAKAQIDEFGSYAITDHGFVYTYGGTDNSTYINTSNKVSISNAITKDTFSTTINLSDNNYYSSGYKYYVRAFITNEKGTVYGNVISFDPLVLSLQSISPATAKISDTVTIYGSNFDPILTNNVVKFYNSSYFSAEVIQATKTMLKVIVPDFSTGYYYNYDNFDITVTVGSQTRSLNDVFSPAFSVTGFSPNTGTFGSSITIYGSNFGQISGIMFGDVPVTYYSTYNSYINVTVPSNVAAKKFKLYIMKGIIKTEVPGGEFVMNKLTASSFSPTIVYPGSYITISGNNFNTSYNYNKVFFNTLSVDPNSFGSSSVSAYVPSSLTAGNYTLYVSNGMDTVKLPGALKVVVPTITGISPTSGYPGTDLIISGHNFNTGSSYVYLGSSSYYAYSNDSTTYKITIPSYLSPGTYRVSVNGGNNQIYSPTDFIILAPTLTSITPATGTVGTAVIIKGEGFGTNASNVSVKFGSISATVSAINDTQINAIVPSGVGGGAWMVTVSINGYAIAKSLAFNVP